MDTLCYFVVRKTHRYQRHQTFPNHSHWTAPVIGAAESYTNYLSQAHMCTVEQLVEYFIYNAAVLYGFRSNTASVLKPVRPRLRMICSCSVLHVEHFSNQILYCCTNSRSRYQDEHLFLLSYTKIVVLCVTVLENLSCR